MERGFNATEDVVGLENEKQLPGDAIEDVTDFYQVVAHVDLYLCTLKNESRTSLC